jgi:purine-nucleoside phosphorylase
MKASPDEIEHYEKDLREAAGYLQKTFGPAPDLGVVFGSGLGGEFLRARRPAKSLAFEEVPHLGQLSVVGHPGRLHYYPRSKEMAGSLIIFHGRRHFYEGVDPAQVVFPYRAAALWGLKRILLTNAAGALRKGLKPGDLVLIEDHINFSGFNPLRGPNLSFLGPRFPSLHQMYKGELARAFRGAARSVRVPVRRGTYVGVMGPSYETPAEVRAFRKWGGDLVGMSTVPEAIASAHAGMDVAAVSAVANTASQIKMGLEHEYVLSQVRRCDGRLAKILLRLVQQGFSE